MTCIVYTVLNLPDGASPAREVTEFTPFYTNVQAVGASHGAISIYVDPTTLPPGFFDGITVKPITLRAVSVPNSTDAEVIKEAANSHELHGKIGRAHV